MTFSLEPNRNYIKVILLAVLILTLLSIDSLCDHDLQGPPDKKVLLDKVWQEVPNKR